MGALLVQGGESQVSTAKYKLVLFFPKKEKRTKCESRENLRLNHPNIPLSKLHLGILGSNRWRNNNILSDLPVNRRRNPILITSLQRVDHPQNLRRIPPSGCRIAHSKPNLLLRIDNEDRANGKRDLLLIDTRPILGVDHVVPPRDLALLVGNDGEGLRGPGTVEGGAGDLIYVVGPLIVRGEPVGGEADELNVAFCEFGRKLGEGAEFRRADGCEVGWVGEQDYPAVADKPVSLSAIAP